MSTYKLLDNDAVLIMQPMIIDKYGKNGAAILSQLRYWDKKTGGVMYEKKHWVYNKASEIAKQVRCCKATFWFYIKKFVEDGLIEIKQLHRNKFNHINYYRICYENLRKFFGLSSQVEENTSKQKNNDTVKKLDDRESRKQNLSIHRLPTKILNKSIEGYPQEEQVTKQEVVAVADKQVEQVNNQNLNFKREKELEEDYNDKNHGHKPSNTTAQDMLAIWNEIVAVESPVVMSGALAAFFVQAYKTKFNENLNEWKDYCHLIAATRTNSFEPNINWALRFSTIDRFMNGGATTQHFSKQTKKHESPPIPLKCDIDSSNEPENIKVIKKEIIKRIGIDNYKSWFSQLKFIDQDGEIGIIPPNNFVKEYLEVHFLWESELPFLKGSNTLKNLNIHLIT